jgi:aminoglycoside 6'-N-acetyltransferase I
MPRWRIREALPSDRREIATLRHALWPESPIEEHSREPVSTLPVVTFVALDEHGSQIGFLDAGLRSHADGCDTAKPVGYVEGWFVREEFRNRGVGRELISAAEDWARGQGCIEMASDALIDNDGSQQAHQALGYEVVDRCVHYRKAL